MKIALIRSTFSPFGGVERVALGMVQGLLERGVDVTLLTLPHQSWPMVHANLHLAPMGILRTHRLVQAWSFNRAVCKYLERRTFDAVVSLDRVTRFTHLHAGGGTHKSFLEIKNSRSGWLARKWRQLSLFHNYMLSLEKKGFSNPRLVKIRCNSNLVKSDIQNGYQVPAEKMVVIYSGIRWQDMAAPYAQRDTIGKDLQKKHNLDLQKKYLLFLGSGFSRKGLDVAVQGLRVLPGDYHLVVVGKGSPVPYLKAAAQLNLKERLHFLGPQPQGWRYASFCKALVLTSHYDPFGGASAEGHAMGLPVLVSDTTGYADRVIHGQNGIILKTPITPENIENSFKALLELINHPVQTPDQIRMHAQVCDDEVILDRLLTEFLCIPS